MGTEHDGGAGGQPVSLKKISLTKAAPTVSLTKAGQSQGILTVNLNWSSNPYQPVDLDLACLYQLHDGSTGVVQALGNSFGNLYGPPFIALGGDDRTGQAAAGETMWINLQRPDVFRRILVFAFIYQGAANWAAANGVVTMYPSSGPPIEVQLDSPVDGANLCAVAQLYTHGGGLAVNREVRYVHGFHPELDRLYGWGMQWAPTYK